MKKPEKLLYQHNKISFYLMLLYIACLSLFVALILRSMPINMMLGLFSMGNIVLILFAFLTSVKIKSYDPKYQFVPLGFALILGIQLFFIPAIQQSDYNIVLISGIVGVIAACVSAVFAIYKTRIRIKYIQKTEVDETQLVK